MNITLSSTVTYGLIVYHQNPGEEPVFHISQRRDTLAYIHFIRGYVSEEKLELYYSRMTLEEKNRIRNHSFEELWFDLFSDIHKIKTEQMKKSKERFNMYSESKKLEEAYLSTVNKSIELEWGIPKGRKKNIQEPDLVCAQREYREETRNKCYLEFLDYPPIECKNTNKNELIYYYIAKSKFRPQPKYYSLPFDVIKRNSVSEETGDLKWTTLSQSEIFLPIIYQCILQEVSEILKHHQSFLILQDAITKYRPSGSSGSSGTHLDT
jgi:hypothetical protein